MRRSWISSALLALALSGCSISRISIGSPLPPEPLGIEPGVTGMSEVLATLGAPSRIVRGPSGEIFVYRYLRRNSDSFAIEEPVITNLELFSYSRVDEREDRLVILFDAAGRVLSSGRWTGVPELDR